MGETVETPKKRAPRSDKGVKRGPKIKYPIVEEALVMPEREPPVHVKVSMKGMEPFEFGCSQHVVQNGFHVFIYPSKRDPYRDTRREIAISEVIDIEITEARPRQVYDFTQPSALPDQPSRILPAEIPNRGSGRPVIHSAKDDAMRRMTEQLEQPVGSVKLDGIPGISLGGSDS
jgi:hypothetical protein